MKRIILAMALVCAAFSSYAQHSVQVDDGAGRIGILSANGAMPIGITTFLFPSSGGTLLTTGSLAGTAWLTGGNAGTTAGTNYAGTSDNVAFHLYVNAGANNSFILNTNGSIHRLGGNARGTDAVDLQNLRIAATQVASGTHSTIGGGRQNSATGNQSTVGGGNGNTAGGDWSTVAGGNTNSAGGPNSFIGGGTGNETTDDWSSVSGGWYNKAYGEYTAIPGGQGLTLDASADRSFGFLSNAGGGHTMIISASNTAVFGNTHLWLANNTNTPSELRFFEAYNTNGAFPNTAKHVAFKSPSALTATQTYTLPVDYPSSNGEALVSTTGGTMSWVSIPAVTPAWSLTGNAGTTAGTNFVGTTDVTALHLYVNSGTTNSFILNTNGSLQRDNAGNARGQYAVDLQMRRTLAIEVASGHYSTIGGGSDNIASGFYSTIGGGGVNTTSGSHSTVGGGYANNASSLHSTIGGGTNNNASADNSTIGGGRENTASEYGSTIGGGVFNIANKPGSRIGGGSTNTASGDYSSIGGGLVNIANKPGSTIGGGSNNIASGDYSSIGGGVFNTASGTASTVGGGESITASGANSTVGGGKSNTATADNSTVGGGSGNDATANNSTIAGGIDNTIANTALRAFIGGGSDNSASGQFNVIGGGFGNTISGNRASILGGGSNTVNGDYSAIVGGQGMQLDGDRALGFNANDFLLSNDITITASDVVVFSNADLWLANNNSTPSSLMFYESYGTTGAFPNTAKYVALKSPATLTATQTYELPLDYPSSNGQALVSTTGGTMSWAAVGAGDVVGPASALDNAVTRFDGTTGKLIQNSALIVEDYSTSTQNKTVVRADDGATANISLVLAPKGAGALIASNPNGATSGGNARGNFAVDLQLERSGATEVASGLYSVITGGRYNTASVSLSVVGGGESNNNTGTLSVIGGGYQNAMSGPYSVIGGGSANTVAGDQSVIPGGRNLTLSATADNTFGFNSGNTAMTISAASTSVFANSDLWLANNDNTPRQLRFYDAYNASGAFPNTAKHVAFKAPTALTATQTYTLPVDYPSSNGMALVSTTGGAMSWAAGGGGSSTSFTTAGTHNWVVPGGVTQVNVKAWASTGGGGGGGGDNETGGGDQGGSGGGGGGGQYCDATIIVTPGETLTINIGAAGIAGTAGTTTTDGGDGGDAGDLDIDGSTSGANLIVLGGGDGGLGGEVANGGGANGDGGNGGNGGNNESTNTTITFVGAVFENGNVGGDGGNDAGAVGTGHFGGGAGGLGGTAGGVAVGGSAGSAGAVGRVYLSW